VRPDSPAVIDTMVFSWVFSSADLSGRAARYAAHLTGRRLLMSAQTAAELRYGALSRNWGEARREQLERRIERVSVVPIDDDLTKVYAEVKDRCRRAGHALAQKDHDGDRWIAATAIKLELSLISDDGLFEDVPGLLLITERGER
jgi:predicted nucleic acid-binding protein